METLPAFRYCGWTAPALSREQVADPTRLHPHAGSSVIVSTCQRVEVYHVGPCTADPEQTRDALAALRHLSEVAAGLHSVVLGEEQVLGQVRDAWAGAPPDLAALGAIAIGAARRLRARRGLHRDTGELLDAALDAAGIRPSGRIVVVGTGALGRRLAARALILGFDEVLMAGRSMPAGLDESGIGWVQLASLAAVGPVDVLASSLGAGAASLDALHDLPPVRSLIADLATPGNIAGEQATTRITLAALAARTSLDADPLRRELAQELHAILDDRLRPSTGAQGRNVAQLRANIESLRRTEADRIRRLHPQIAAADVDAITHSLVNRLFHSASERLRELEDPQLSESVAALFAQEEPQ